MYQSLSELRQSLIAKQTTAVDIVKQYLSRLKKIDPAINAFITVTDKQALAAAKKLDKKTKKGKLAGGIFAVKDIYLTQGIETTAGSQVLKGYIPQYSSTVYQKLLNEDAILIGKTNTDAFAFGASTENSGYFPSKNPWDTSRVPGGSSGGSAAAQAADLCTFALGTDTGGSIRQPASLCSVTGIKPTYGRNSRYGITAMASSFDCPGTFGHTVADVALVSQIMAGADSHDATTSDQPSPRLSPTVKKLKIGLPSQYFADLDPVIKKVILQAVDIFKQQGHTIVDVSLPNTDLSLAVYYILVPCEISSNMARYDGIRFGQSKKDAKNLLSYYMDNRGAFMEPELKRRILIGTYALSAGYFDAYYLQAAKVRTLIIKDFSQAFKQVDVLLAPVSPTPAWPLGQKVNDPLQMYLADIYTCPVNVAGLPALALPGGFTTNNLPVGFQLIGDYWQESTLFALGHQFQQLTDYHLKHPQL